ncbi:phosphoglucosamine mutase [Candidatus Thorarchaeota archaeon]|nr:MAG: phosphoglucosamine mutase [Candidatus Thorarchaeota archaeon]
MANDLFGTTGVRKVYGSEFTLDMAMKLGKALGTYLQTGKILIARDTRTTGKMVVDAFVAGVLSTGVDVTRLGIVPTPTLAYLTKKMGFDAGVMVTASHNPPEYTGIKFWHRDSMGYTSEMEKELETLYTSGGFKVAPWNELGQEAVLGDAVEKHIVDIIDHCDSEAINRKEFKVIVDPGNGAACVLTPYLVRELGCKVVTINGQPDGHFPGRESEPEEETLQALIHMVRKQGADLGIAHDGDSDRGVFVTETGEVVRGDRTIALLAKTLLKKEKGSTVVTTVDSSKVLDEIVQKTGGDIVRTPVGDIQVAVKLKELGGIMGGEACGVFIFPSFHMAPEPFLAACKILEMMAHTGKSFGVLVSEIPIYPLLKTKLQVANDKKKVVMQELSGILPKEIDGIQDVITVDGIGLVLDDGWVLVRPSGTEPVIRITCEATTDDRVHEILDSCEQVVRKTIASQK